MDEFTGGWYGLWENSALIEVKYFGERPASVWDFNAAILDAEYKIGLLYITVVGDLYTSN